MGEQRRRLAVAQRRSVEKIDFGAATVANDVVFTSTFDGTIYALSTRHGSILWSTKTPEGINSYPAVTRKMLIVSAGARTTTRKTRGEIVAYSLQ